MIKSLLYYVVFTLWYLFSLLPFWVLYRVSDLLYPLVYHVVRYRRSVVRDNLVSSFPDKSPEEIRRIEHKFYRFFCDYIVETIKLFSVSRKSMMKHMRFSGLGHLDEAFRKQGKHFVFVYLGHYGNWEWIASLPYHVSDDVLCTQIYHPLYNEAFDKLFLRLRHQFGGVCIPMKQTLRRIIELKARRQKTVVGFIADQLPKWNAIHFFLPFLHHETAVFTGAEQMGRKVDAVYLFARITRPRRGYYECTFEPMPEPSSEADNYDVTTCYMQRLEQMITEAPQYWLWSHKRWKRTKEEWLQRQQAAKEKHSLPNSHQL